MSFPINTHPSSRKQYTMPMEATSNVAVAQTPMLVPVVPSTPIPIPEHVMVMGRDLFTLASTMIDDCSKLEHTNYKDYESYTKDFEMRWSRAIALIEQIDNMMTRTR
jgi:hypothetical protein